MEVSNLTKETLIKMFSEGKRFDNRKLDEYRNISVEYDVSNKAEGSARVKIGKTEVIAGIKLGIGEPYPDSPEKGNLIVSAELLPIASPRYETGPPRFEAIEIARMIDRGIRESGMIELDKLCIKEGERVWTVFIDIYPINNDGNLLDAAGIATVAALKNAVVPVLDKDDKIDYTKKSKTKIPLLKETAPLIFSFFKLGNSIITDPTREEEEACDTRVSFGVSLYNKKSVINSCQKSGNTETPITKKELENIMKILPKKFEELNKKLKNFL